MASLYYSRARQVMRATTQLTQYEHANGITCTGHAILLDTPDIITILQHKSDNSSTLKIIFSAGLNNKSWFVWVPTKAQMDLWDDVGLQYWTIDTKNKLNKNRECL